VLSTYSPAKSSVKLNPFLQKIERREHHRGAGGDEIPVRRSAVRYRWGRMKGGADVVVQIFTKSRGPHRWFPRLVLPTKGSQTINNVHIFYPATRKPARGESIYPTTRKIYPYHPLPLGSGRNRSEWWTLISRRTSNAIHSPSL
jgi:hypothetical protein